MARTKKLKIQFYDMEISAPDKVSISLLTEIIEKAAVLERQRGHLFNHSEYMEILDVILDTSAIVMGNIKSKSVQINNGAVIEGMCSQCYADVNPTSFFDEYKKNKK